MSKWKALRCKKKTFRIISGAKYEVSEFHEKASKWKAKRVPRLIQNRVLSAQGVRIWVFGRLIESWEVWIYMILWMSKNNNKLINRDGDAKSAIVPKGSAAEAGSSRGFWSQQESVRVCKKHSRRPAPCKQGAADLKATPHAVDPLNEIKKKECLAEREGFRCQHEAKKVSKTIEMGSKEEPKRAKEPSNTPLRHMVATNIKKVAKRRKPVVPKN